MAGSRLSLLAADEPFELDAWLKAWREWPNHDVWSNPYYVRLFIERGVHARCAFFDDGRGNRALYPFLQRDIAGAGASGDFSDIASAYGYGGPSFSGDVDASELSTAFWEEFDNWAVRERIVSEFIRFRLEDSASYPGTVVDRQTNYVARLGLDEASLIRSFEPKVRKNMRRAESSGVKIIVDERGERLDEFLDIYYETMDRRDAAKIYYFERSFFEQIQRDLPGSFAFFHALSGSRIISTELVLVSAQSVTSFLGGTDSEFYHLRPNDLLKVHIMLWAKNQGKRQFILGGGAVPGDGIERYKKSFAPRGAVTFRTGQRTFLEDVSRHLVDERRAAEHAKGREWPRQVTFFPEYRVAL